MHVLVDMDGVLADFERHARSLLAASHPQVADLLPAAAEQRQFYLADELPSSHRRALRSICDTPGFFRDLPPVDGALDALEQMRQLCWQVTICTAPLTSNPACASDKLAWVAEHLGRDWVKQTVICKDKTLVRGTVLIDDKPQVSGSLVPEWTHVLYTRPYNEHVEGVPRVTWDTWRDTLVDISVPF